MAAAVALMLAVAVPVASAATPPKDPAPSPEAAKPVAYAKPVSTRLNTTGRTITMPVPFKDDGQDMGEIVIRIDPEDRVLIPKAALVDKLTPILDKEALARLHGMRDSNGQISLADLAEAGFNIKFDPGQLVLLFLPNADQRPVGDLSLSRRRGPSVSPNLSKPAIFSSYLNLTPGVDHRWGDSVREDATSLRLDIESVFRMWNIVVENEFTYEGEVDTNSCPPSAICTTQHEAGIKRRRSRLVYDVPDWTMRVQAGDADVYGTGLQRAPDLLGISIEKSPRKLSPGENIRPTGRSSFRIERPSDVEVVINGAIVQKLRLRAGNYNLSDLPLATGANEVQLIITDDTGDRRTLAFTTFFDGNLLAKGKNEWSLAGGVPSYFEDGERQYQSDEYFASGFYRYGLSDQLTVEMHAQADSQVEMGGAGAFAMTPFGFFGLQGAVSNSPTGVGFALNINYDLINFQGPAFYFLGNRETVRLGAEYRTEHFRTPGEFTTTASGILFPQYNYWLKLSAAYSVPLPKQVSATLGGRYQFADDGQIVLSPYTLKGDRYGIDLTLSSPITTNATGSLTFGYSNESYLVTDATADDGAAFRVMARIFVRPDEKTQVTASYDSLNRDAYVSGYRSFGQGVGRWETSVDVQKQGRDDGLTAGGAVSYYGNRAEVRASHTSAFDGVDWQNLKVTPSEQRTSVTAGVSLAFADGRFAVGPPIRGNGFAIIYPHESIAGKAITVGTQEDVRARSDWLGPVLVTDVPAYTNSSLPVDVADLPVGYSLGTGAFDTLAPYKAGYALEVGSAYSVSAYGTLLLANGEPVALLTGVASPVDNPQKQVAIFTNSVGRFGAEGLSPGSWIIEMATEGAPTRYRIEVPKGTDGLFKAGELRPAG